MADLELPKQTGIVTHSGRFHCDEVFASAILKIVGRWSGDPSTLVRTRNMEIIDSFSKSGFYVVDVGQVYSASNRRFDHHQTSFEEYFCLKAKSLGVKMSSCGLIFSNFGHELFSLDLVEEDITRFYDLFLLEIDANDNGVPEIVKPNEYFFKPRMNIPGIIGRFNGEDVDDNVNQLNNFMTAVGVAEIIAKSLVSKFESDIQQQRKAKEICDKADTLDFRSRLVWVLYDKCDYTSTLRELSTKNYIFSTWVFTVLPRTYDLERNIVEWQVHTVNKPGEKFKHWIDIISSDEAKKLIGNDLVFVHNNKFIAVTKSRQSALRLVRESIKKYDIHAPMNDGTKIAIAIELFFVVIWFYEITTGEIWTNEVFLFFILTQISALFFFLF